MGEDDQGKTVLQYFCGLLAGAVEEARTKEPHHFAGYISDGEEKLLYFLRGSARDLLTAMEPGPDEGERWWKERSGTLSRALGLVAIREHERHEHAGAPAECVGHPCAVANAAFKTLPGDRDGTLDYLQVTTLVCQQALRLSQARVKLMGLEFGLGDASTERYTRAYKESRHAAVDAMMQEELLLGRYLKAWLNLGAGADEEDEALEQRMRRDARAMG